MTSLDRSAANKHLDPSAAANAPEHRRGRQEDTTAPQVLIVEDEFFVALDLETTLTRAGFEIVGVASNAEDAVRLAEALQPSIVIMDIRLAGHRDGIDAATEIFQRFGIRSVFATAHHDPGTVARAEPANAAGWLAKPYSPQAVIAALQTALKLPPVQ